jgi:hypothetical protein
MELVVVLACIAVITGISAFQMVDWLARYRLRHAATDLFSLLQAARMRAIRTSGEVAVVFSTKRGSYQLVSGGKNRRYEGNGPDSDDVVEKKVVLSAYGSGIRFGYGSAREKATRSGGGFSPGDEVSYIDDYAEFNGRGMANKMGYVYIQNSRQSVCAVATPTRAGVVHLTCWDGSRWR